MIANQVLLALDKNKRPVERFAAGHAELERRVGYAAVCLERPKKRKLKRTVKSNLFTGNLV